MASHYAKRHYCEIAAIFKSERPADHWDACKRLQHNMLLREFDRMFSLDNARFDRDRFIAACGGYCPD